MIDIKGLFHRYIREYFALYDINLNLKNGEKIAFVGGEDSGKTSLIRILAKLEKPSAGEIYINDINIKKISYKTDVSVGYIPVHPIFFERKSVFANIKYILKSRNFDKEKLDLKIDEILKKYDLQELKDKKINEVSLFEKYKLSVARLSIRELDIVLIDNIFENFDESQTAEFIKLINANFKADKTTLIVATSSEEIADKICTKKIYFKLGSIVSTLKENQ